MSRTTSRLGIPVPTANDPDNVPGDLGAAMDRIDTVLGAAGEGALANRPAPGNPRFTYFATDAPNSNGSVGELFYDTGTAWVPINPVVVTAGNNPAPIQVGGDNPTTSLPGDQTAIGSTGIAADALHKHAREPFAGALPNVTATNQSGIPNPAIGQTAYAFDAAQIMVWDGDHWIFDCNSTIIGVVGRSGTPPNINTGLFAVQAGSSNVTTTSAGIATITFPQPFPGGIITVVASIGADTGGLSAVVGGSINTTNFPVVVFNASGVMNNFATVVNWIAYGW